MLGASRLLLALIYIIVLVYRGGQGNQSMSQTAVSYFDSSCMYIYSIVLVSLLLCVASSQESPVSSNDMISNMYHTYGISVVWSREGPRSLFSVARIYDTGIQQ